MVQFRPSAREIVAKIVYYGPPLGGKTTNLKMLWQGYPDEVRGELIVLPTGTDRTIFFDYLPLTFRRLRGMDLRIQLYTVPGQVRFDSTRQVVLRGVDGVVFVADSQRQALAANRESWANLKKNLALQGLFLDRVPHVLQFNKRDLADILSVEELNQTLNEFNVPFFEAVAIQGIGVEETLEAIAKLVVRSLRDRFNLAMEPQPGLQVIPQAAEDVATRPVSIKPQPLPRNGLGSREPLPPPELTPPTVPLEVVEQPRGGDVVALFPREESPGAAAVEQAQAASSAADFTPQTSAFALDELAPAPSEGGEPFLPASQPPTEQLAVSGDVAFFLPESGSISLVASPFELPGPDMAPQASPDLELFGQEPLRGEAQAEPSAPSVSREVEVFAPPTASAAAEGGESLGPVNGQDLPSREPASLAGVSPNLPLAEHVPASDTVFPPWEGTDPFPLDELPAAGSAEEVFALVPQPARLVEVPALPVERLMPHAIARHGELRELEVEVPVPATWVGGRRVTLQLRLTLVPEEERREP